MRRAENSTVYRATPAMAEVAVHLDDDLLQAMHDEAELLGDGDLEITISRRLVEGIGLAVMTGRDQLLWRPVHSSAIQVRVHVPAETADDLIELGSLFGYDPAILACTILYNDACRPRAVRAAISAAGYTPLRRERGRGSIYPVKFELAGYQLVFLRMMSSQVVTRDVVVSEALLALAREVQVTGSVGGRPVDDEAIAFARQMVSVPAWNTFS